MSAKRTPEGERLTLAAIDALTRLLNLDVDDSAEVANIQQSINVATPATAETLRRAKRIAFYIAGLVSPILPDESDLYRLECEKVRVLYDALFTDDEKRASVLIYVRCCRDTDDASLRFLCEQLTSLDKRFLKCRDHLALMRKYFTAPNRKPAGIAAALSVLSGAFGDGTKDKNGKPETKAETHARVAKAYRSAQTRSASKLLSVRKAHS
jgi:hypothetical protein